MIYLDRNERAARSADGRDELRFYDIASYDLARCDYRTVGNITEASGIGPVAFRDFVTEVMSGDQPAFEGEDCDGATIWKRRPRGAPLTTAPRCECGPRARAPFL